MKSFRQVFYGMMLFIGSGMPLFAQSVYQVKGRVMEDSTIAATFATVRVFHLPDSTLAGGAISDSVGWFHLELPAAGTYLLKVSLLGRQSAELPFQLKQGQYHVQLPPVQLQTGSHALQAVQIVATRPFIEQQPGKTVLHVEGSPTAAGSDVLDIFTKSTRSNGRSRWKHYPEREIGCNGDD